MVPKGDQLFSTSLCGQLVGVEDWRDGEGDGGTSESEMEKPVALKGLQEGEHWRNIRKLHFG